MNVKVKVSYLSPYCQCKVESYRIPEDIDLNFIVLTESYSGLFIRRPREYRTYDKSTKVTEIYFLNCDLTKVPQEVLKSLPNLQSLIIHKSKLKHITKDDLAEYKTFKKIDLSENEIDFLPGDLFEGFDNLETILFNGNKLSIVEPNILDGLVKLKHVNLNGETKYGSFDVKFAVRDFDREMKEMKINLIEKFCTNSQGTSEYMLKQHLKLQQSKEMNAKLTKEMEEIQQKLRALEQSNDNLKTIEEDLTNQINNKDAAIQNQAQLIKNLEGGLEKKEQKIQQMGEHFCDDLKNFIQDKTTKDFRIQIDDQEFPVHKFLLSARSPTLAEILRNNPEVENLNLVDISVEIFEKILKFVYTDELPCEDGMNFLHLFAAAGKLKIEELKNFAAEKVFNQIDTENMLEVLKVGNKYHDDLISQKSLAKIKEKYPKIEFKDEWINDDEKVEKLIKFFKEMEEKEENFKRLMM